MNTASFNVFECHMYVSARGNMNFSLPAESGPRHIARLEPVDHERLIEPSFRRLLATFESISSLRPAYVGAGQGGASTVNEAY